MAKDVVTKAAAAAASDPSTEQLLAMYRQMAIIRLFDETAERLSRAGEIYGEVHQYVGQEAVAVGVCSVLQDEDIVTSTHRGHGHIIAKGGDVRRMLAELFGKEDGYCRGRGGSMHIACLDLGVLGANGIVGAGTPIAVGAALAAVRQGTGTVAVSFFGDGAANQGVVHEAMNLASIFRLPVLFVCENNRYSVSTPTKAALSVRDVASRAAAYGMPGIIVDGMDVLAVREASADAVQHVRDGAGPVLLEAKTYRFHGHFSAEQKLLRDRTYRSDWELANWRLKDPIARLGDVLVSIGAATKQDLEAIGGNVEDEIRLATQFARNARDPDAAMTAEDTYAVPYPELVPRGWQE